MFSNDVVDLQSFIVGRILTLSLNISIHETFEFCCTNIPPPRCYLRKIDDEDEESYRNYLTRDCGYADPSKSLTIKI